MSRVGLDVDGVLADFQGAFREFASLVDGVDYPEARTWKFWQEYGWTEGRWKEMHWQFVQDGWYGDLPVLGGVETLAALDRLKAAGHDIILITARHTVPGQQEMIEQDTHYWLDGNGIPADEVHFTSDKTSVDVDYFLDDRFSNYEAFCEQENVLSFLLDAPWNKEERGSWDWHWTVNSVAEYVDRILDREPFRGEAKIPDEYRPVGYLNIEDLEFKDPTLPTQDRINEAWSNIRNSRPMTATFTLDEPINQELMDEIFGPSKNDESENVSSEEVRVTSETGGQKGRKPAELATVDPLALWEVARVSGFGANKYEAFNYLKGFDWSLSYSAMQRHLMQFWSGQDRDEESGELHIAHAAWHALALISFYVREVGTDDRPPR